MKIVDELTKVGWKYKPYNGEVGIEIETESITPYDIPSMKYWTTVRDGSLRDFGVEYILTGPINRGKELEAALGEWNTKINKTVKLIPDSVSTSVHVHLNFLQDKWVTMVNFITSYFLMENLLIRYSGPTRLSNLFCLPICDADYDIEQICNMIQSVGRNAYKRVNMNVDEHKYAALNFCNLSKLGTLEVRSMRGTTDIDVIRKWVHILMAIKDFSAKEGLYPTDILDLYKHNDLEILNIIFGDYAKELNFPDKRKLIDQNLWYAAKVASATKINESDWGFTKPKKIVKEKLLDALNVEAQNMFGADFKDLNNAHKIVVEEVVLRNLNTTRAIFHNQDE